MSALSPVFLKNLFDNRPHGNMLVVLCHGEMFVITRFSFKECLVKRLRGVHVDSQELAVTNPQFTGYWYMPETTEIRFTGLEDPFAEKLI